MRLTCHTLEAASTVPRQGPCRAVIPGSATSVPPSVRIAATLVPIVTGMLLEV